MDNNNYNNFDQNYTNNMSQPEYMSTSTFNGFMTKVYGWMFVGLLITAFTALAFVIGASYSPLIQSIFQNQFIYLGLFIAEIALVISLSKSVMKMSASEARAKFIAYSALNGLTLSSIFVVYSWSAIVISFSMAALFFGIMSIYGMFTKSDLTSIGKILFIGLIALIICSFVNIFIGSNSFGFLISIIGVAIFTGLTAYDTQKIKSIYFNYAHQAGEQAVGAVSIVGALTLYLDFINIFLFLLRIFGRKR